MFCSVITQCSIGTSECSSCPDSTLWLLEVARTSYSVLTVVNSSSWDWVIPYPIMGTTVGRVGKWVC
jgi:hypothetical protein